MEVLFFQLENSQERCSCDSNVVLSTQRFSLYRNPVISSEARNLYTHYKFFRKDNTP